MSLKDFFLGTETEKKARIDVTDLAKNAQLTKKQKRKLDEARRIARRPFLRCITTFGISAATGGTTILLFAPQEESSKTSPTEQNKPTNMDLLDFESIKSIYDEGFNTLMQNIPQSAQHTDPMDIRILSTLKFYRNNMVHWAVADDQNVIVAAENGNKHDGWLAVATPNNPSINEEQHKNVPVWVDSSSTDMDVLIIKPIKISPIWAGIILVHELQHLWDRTSGNEPRKPNQDEYLAGEVRAYGAEFFAVDYFTQGRFRQAVNDVIREFKIYSTDDVSKIFGQQDYKYIVLTIIKKLDEAIGSEPPNSKDERALRTGFYEIFLAFEVERIKGLNGSDLQESYKQSVKKIMEAGRSKSIPAK